MGKCQKWGNVPQTFPHSLIPSLQTFLPFPHFWHFPIAGDRSLVSYVLGGHHEDDVLGHVGGVVADALEVP
jgi:hypothetical protein